MLEADAVAKRYPCAQAVRAATLRVDAREFVAIVGRSGSGKSTLLAMLACLTRPSDGRVTFDGVDPWLLDEAARSGYRARDIAIVLQLPSLLADLRAIDNVALPALLARTMRPAQAYERAGALLRDVGLAGREDAYPATMSGGEQRRAAIARALINEPRLVLADEPTGDLDATSARDVVALLDRLRHAHGFALVVATHDEALAHRADTLYAMESGVLSAVSELAQVRDVALPVRCEAIWTQVRVEPRPALGAPLQAIARKAAFAIAVAASFVLLADSMAARYQRHRLEQEAARAGALETAALSQLRANVRFIAPMSSGGYELGLELANAAAAAPLKVTAPAVRAYVQVGRQWTELPMSPVVERGSSVVTIAGPEVFRYRFEARTPDYARLFSRYMHVRFLSTMLVGAEGAAPAELFERSDSYYVYLKPADADDRDILREARFEGVPPLWIAMPSH